MRLLGIKSVNEANEFLTTYLPKYNRRFTKPAVSDADLHRDALHSRELDRILCIKEERTVKNDFIVAHNRMLYQIEEVTRAQKVTVEERLDGTMRISYRGKDLSFREIATRQVEKASESASLVPERKPWTPSVDHPWRKSFLSKRKNRKQPAAAP